MILDVDIGNTRLKWRLRTGESTLCQGAFVWRSGDWSALSALSVHNLRRIRVSNVGGENAQEQLQKLASSYFQIVPEYASSSKTVGAVVSGYLEPEQLGVDRWLAILAGWNLFGQECVIIDAGSAMTLDFVDASGKHLGGYIVPGREMMRNSLYGGTCGVKAEASAFTKVVYGQDTSDAVQNGCLAMTLALIEKVGAEADSKLSSPLVLLTGGDAENLWQYLPVSTVYKPDLVLDGLALALP